MDKPGSAFSAAMASKPTVKKPNVVKAITALKAGMGASDKAGMMAKMQEAHGHLAGAGPDVDDVQG